MNRKWASLSHNGTLSLVLIAPNISSTQGRYGQVKFRGNPDPT
jgi:hypothetical protein